MKLEDRIISSVKTEGDAYQLLGSVEVEAPDEIIDLLNTTQDQVVILAILSDLSWSKIILQNDKYLRAVENFIDHTDQEIRYYAHESLAMSGREKYYETIKAFIQNPLYPNEIGLISSFFRPFISRHENEIVGILSEIISQGDIHIKLDTYQTLCCCRARESQGVIKRMRKEIEAQGGYYKQFLKEFDAFIKDYKDDQLIYMPPLVW